MSDLLHQNLGVAQSDQQPAVRTIASAATIAPSTRLTRITGTTEVTTITPPVSGYHELVFIWTTGTANGFNTGGNIGIAYTTVTNRPVTLYYDNVAKVYYPMAVS